MYNIITKEKEHYLSVSLLNLVTGLHQVLYRKEDRWGKSAFAMFNSTKNQLLVRRDHELDLIDKSSTGEYSVSRWCHNPYGLLRVRYMDDAQILMSGHEGIWLYVIAANEYERIFSCQERPMYYSEQFKNIAYGKQKLLIHTSDKLVLYDIVTRETKKLGARNVASALFHPTKDEIIMSEGFDGTYVKTKDIEGNLLSEGSHWLSSDVKLHAVDDTGTKCLLLDRWGSDIAVWDLQKKEYTRLYKGGVNNVPYLSVREAIFCDNTIYVVTNKALLAIPYTSEEKN